MAWPNDLYPARYRNVPFEFVSSGVAFERRHQVHEFPGRDGAVVEDLGRAPDRFSLEAFVIGDDWIERKHRLLDACMQKGRPGILLHPWFGSMAAFCTKCQVNESSSEGGIVRFQLEFLRVLDVTLLSNRPRPSASVDTAAEAIGASAEAETATGLVASNVPDFVREASADTFTELGNLMRGLDIFSGPATEAALMAQRVSNLVTQASVLATSPVLAAAQVRGAIELVIDSVSNAVASLYAYESFFVFEARELGGVSLFSDARDNNARLIAAQVRQTALAGACRAAAAIDWETYDDALAARTRVLLALDAELDRVTPAQYSDMARLRASLVGAVPAPERNLPRLLRLELPGVVSALELAYQLYDDRTRADELVARNRPEYPGRLPALATLEVLSR